MSLMYSTAKSRPITAAQLAEVPTPQARGRFHQTVGFGDFTDLVLHRLANAGITVEKEEYVLDKSGNTFFGAMELSLDGFTRSDMTITLGVRGSHTQKLGRGLCIGNRVIVCDNLMFGGDITGFHTKQTTNIWSRLPGLVDNAVAQIPALAQKEGRRADAYKQFALKPQYGDAALVALMRQGALTPAQIGRAASEWIEPSFEEHAEDGFTAWRLLNAVTEAQKPTGDTVNMDTIARRTAIASSFLDRVVAVQ